MTGKFDGRLAKYRFGVERSDCWTHEATSLSRAITAFRVGVLFPHTYSTGRVGTSHPGEHGYEETRYLSSKPGAVVQVRACVGRRGEWELLCEIPPEDPEAEYRPDMLPASVAPAAEGADVATAGTALAKASSTTGLAASKRTEMVERRLELERKMGELERQKQEMAETVRSMEKELKRRMEQIWLIELFLGSKERVVRLRDGEAAPRSAKIAIYQRVLCMDEEIAVHQWLHAPMEIGSFEYLDLEDFDRWLLEGDHLDSVLPASKGIRAFRVRRHAKQRETHGDLGAIMAAIHAEEQDRMVYLLVRNGEQLFRLWVDVKVWPRFFPRMTEWDWVPTTRVGHFERKNAKEQAKRFLAGLIVVQGICQRSDLLHPLPMRPEEIDVFDPAQADEIFDCVRDDEVENEIGDGSDESRITWKSYSSWLRSKLAPGVRAFWDGNRAGEKLSERTFMDSVSDWPSKDVPYVLEAYESRWWSYKFSFLYLPEDTVYGNWGEWDPHQRKRRVRFHAYGDELWPVDFISWRVVEHLLQSRSERKHYDRFFKMFSRWHAYYHEVASRERPFIDLVLSQCGLNPDQAPESERARAERLVRWWKSRTKNHRRLEEDEPKALRMVVSAFRRGDDGDDDPEVDLFRFLAGESST